MYWHYAEVPTYSLTQLAKLADVTPRTIRYYISQGLLPSPGQQGPGTQYSDEHLERLRLIKNCRAPTSAGRDSRPDEVRAGRAARGHRGRRADAVEVGARLHPRRARTAEGPRPEYGLQPRTRG